MTHQLRNRRGLHNEIINWHKKVQCLECFRVHVSKNEMKKSKAKGKKITHFHR